MENRYDFLRQVLPRKATSGPLPLQVEAFIPVVLLLSPFLLRSLNTVFLTLSFFAAGTAFHPLKIIACWLASQFVRTSFSLQIYSLIITASNR